MTDAPGAAAPVELFVDGVAGLEGLPALEAYGREEVFPPRDRYLDAARALRAASFLTCSDLCAVDYLVHGERSLPAAVAPERFEVVVHLLSHEQRRRVALRVEVPEGDPHCPSLFPVFPGTENMEREAYDMFGIVFDDHPDMTRILMPEDWEGYPLRKDYGVGRVPVQFKDAPGPR